MIFNYQLSIINYQLILLSSPYNPLSTLTIVIPLHPLSRRDDIPVVNTQST